MNMSVRSLSKKLLPVAGAVALAFGPSAQATDLNLLATFTGSTGAFVGPFIPVNITSPDVALFGNDKDPAGLSTLDSTGYTFFTGMTLPAGTFNFADYYGFFVDPSDSVGVAFGINLFDDHMLTDLHARVFYYPSGSPVVIADSVDTNDGFYLDSFLNTYSLTSPLSGPYFLEVLGNAAGTSSSSYSGQLSFVPAPVPVPAAVWLLGSALTGVVATARRKATA